MNKNTIIVILALSLGVTSYFAFQDKEDPINTNNTDNTEFATNATQPRQELRVAYEESSQHSAMADIAEISCFPTARFDCSSGGCVHAAPSAYFFVDYGTESGTYFRCDAKGCDSYPVEVNQSGEFTQFIPSQGQAMLFKVGTGDFLEEIKWEFVDIATTGAGAVVSMGKCEFVR